MADALYAELVVEQLHKAGVRDVVAIHDAFLTPADALAELDAATREAGRRWLPKLGPVYDALERCLTLQNVPEHVQVDATLRREAAAKLKIARRWRAKWAARVNAGTDWPRFRLKIEGVEVRPA
jgi:hypothetical protein